MGTLLRSGQRNTVEERNARLGSFNNKSQRAGTTIVAILAGRRIRVIALLYATPLTPARNPVTSSPPLERCGSPRLGRS
jgi:hypothetical protein